MNAHAPMPASGPRWPRIATGVGLLLVGALAGMNRVELTHLAETNPREAQDTRLQALAAQVADLAGQLEAYRKPADAVPLSRYEAEREGIEQRLAAIEQATNDRPSDDLQPLRERLARLEEKLAQYTRKAAARTPALPKPSLPPKIAEPSFQMIGIERRADERFLTILPAGTNGLSQVRLLRVGDVEDGWRLEAIEEDAATFRKGGKKHRMNLSGEKP